MSPVLVTAAAVLQLLMMMIPTNTAQQLTLHAERFGPGLDNRFVRMNCGFNNSVVKADFYYRHPHNGRERSLGPAAEIVSHITITEEGYYSCNNSMGQSNLQRINAYPASLPKLFSPPGKWGDPYTAECQYRIGPLSQYYSMIWTIHFSDGTNDVIDCSTTEYLLIGSQLRISTFTPLIQSLECNLTVTGAPPFLGVSENMAKQTGYLRNIDMEQVFSGAATIIQSPQDYTADVGSSAVFQCTARVPNIRNIGFEIFNNNITTADNNCNRISTNKLTCSRVIDSHVVSLTCDYSIGYQINCALNVNFLSSRSSVVFCRVLNATFVEATVAARLIIGRTELSEYPSFGVVNIAFVVTTFIFITSSVFLLILLVAVLCYKQRTQRLPKTKPPLPPSQDTFAYEKMTTKSCAAY